MLKSMTGFAKIKTEKSNREYDVEIKAVNHKYSDVTVKMSRAISYLEEKVRREIVNSISRGKVDVSISFYDFSEQGKNIRINRPLAKMYVEELRQLAKEANIDNNISVMEISKLPDVLKLKSEENQDLIWEELSEVLHTALDSFIQMRITEGEKISQDLRKRILNISEKISKINEYSSRLVEEYVVKLNTRIKEILKTDVIDETRLAQEVVIYSDKCSIEEEITRLKSHISQFLNLLEVNTPIGKKIDFLIQEMNREINTIGSKANCLDITNLVIDIKTEIEDIREQVQNIE